MCHEEFCQDSLQRCEKELRKVLKLQYAVLDHVVALCLRQIEHFELSCTAIEERLANLPKDHKAREEEIDRSIQEVCQQAARSKYVRDCEQIAQFLDSGTSDPDRDQIAKLYHAQYFEWAYRYLNARLIKYKAESELAGAQDMLDEKVFHTAAFAECAAEYEPALGKKFEDFLNQRIRWRAADVAHGIRNRLRLKAGYTATDPATLSFDDKTPWDQGKDWIKVFYDGLRQHLREHDHSRKSVLEVAAYELRHRAYLDPDGMLEETQPLLRSRFNRLKEEFLAYQQRWRWLEDEELEAAKNACDAAMNNLDRSRRALEREDRFADLPELERQASQRNKTEMESELRSLGRAGLCRKEGLQLQYMIDFKAQAMARGRLEKARIDLEKLKRRRKPWVRSQEDIALFLGDIDQVTIARYLKSVEDFMQKWMRDQDC